MSQNKRKATKLIVKKKPNAMKFDKLGFIQYFISSTSTKSRYQSRLEKT